MLSICVAPPIELIITGFLLICKALQADREIRLIIICVLTDWFVGWLLLMAVMIWVLILFIFN